MPRRNARPTPADGHHFMELLSAFTSPPVFSVRHGRVEIGLVPDGTLMARPAGYAAGGAAVLVLAGRSWAILHIDWSRRVVQVQPTDAPGVARWSGSAQPLGTTITRGVREVLLGSDPAGVILSRRAGERLAQLRAEHPWVRACVGRSPWPWSTIWSRLPRPLREAPDLNVHMVAAAGIARVLVVLGLGARQVGRPLPPEVIDAITALHRWAVGAKAQVRLGDPCGIRPSEPDSFPPDGSEAGKPRGRV